MRTPQLWPLTGSSKPKLFPEVGVFLPEPVGEELLQTGILFFKLHQILELIAFWTAALMSDLLFDLAELLGPLFLRVDFPRCPDDRRSDRFR
ncbi:hypothetical protein MAXJ12_35831 [Mesorhizobium alhagi CCNWXJ12-2]|uniref:Uncharacterized protein n=1 Tax=Mesorhizobium alhagi CCNWXJ12-2 TaxID=1107882 RepID=H0I3U9_9HYPH|nr:hypothetical protein MAXJ12_35831 [Mesorhizobium alhagi CCNWXJ12-2]